MHVVTARRHADFKWTCRLSVLFQSPSADTRRYPWTPACPWRTQTWQRALLPPTHATRATSCSGELLPTFRRKRYSHLFHKVYRIRAQKRVLTFFHVFSLFWGVIQPSLVVCYRSFGSVYRSSDGFTLGDGTYRLCRNVGSQLLTHAVKIPCLGFKQSKEVRNFWLLKMGQYGVPKRPQQTVELRRETSRKSEVSFTRRGKPVQYRFKNKHTWHATWVFGIQVITTAVFIATCFLNQWDW